MTFFAIVKPDLTTSKSEQYIFQFGTYNNGYTGGVSDDAGRAYSNGVQSYINQWNGYGRITKYQRSSDIPGILMTHNQLT